MEEGRKIVIASGCTAKPWRGAQIRKRDISIAWMLSCGLVFISIFAAAAQSPFTLVSHGVRARVVVGANEPDFVFRAAQDFTNDVKRITGADLPLVRGTSAQAGDVRVATVPTD